MPSRLSQMLTLSLSLSPHTSVPQLPSSHDDNAQYQNKAPVLTKKRVLPKKQKSKKRNSIITTATLLFTTRSKALPPAEPPLPLDTSSTKKHHRLSLTTKFRKGVVTVPPPPQLLAHLGKACPQHDRHDSTFSSVSSSFTDLKSLTLPSNSRVPASMIPLTRSQLATLSPLLRRLERCLDKQDLLCRSLSANMLYLMAVKERMIRRNGKLGVGGRKAFIGELGEVREELGKVFVRKVGIEGRSRNVIGEVAGKLGKLEMRDLDSAKCAGEVKEREEGVGDVATVDAEMISNIVHILKRDIEIQRLLNICVLDAITRRCWKGRWTKTAGQRTEMERFVGFVAERVEKLGEIQERMIKTVGVVEGVVSGLEG
ncbi:uncharacterized protein BP5553_02290 [Venustampulla echinocandica]|uniref:Uncharacterized protein n=1 Tax=Venustampulla echinocandica TaxID=2656787 RepID=A0A370U3F9_9HELO|nr:uncharacterized protein BP5553_02290 [Venustampulla echinocandica]RDL42311.1 hypothetical protein BP5553_02290 [Venustampulla echinocandica]